MLKTRMLQSVIGLCFVFIITLLILLGKGISYNSLLNGKTKIVAKEDKKVPLPKRVNLTGVETLKTGNGVKAVIFSKDSSKIYSLNLEAMNIFEFDRESRKISRKLLFKPTSGKGYNYQKHEWYDSQQEKPVEGCLTHNGKYLWASLHNAEGIIAWNLKTQDTLNTDVSRSVTIETNGKKSQAQVRFIKTGKTPKVIIPSLDGKQLFVSNWHSHTISVIDISAAEPEKWKKIKDIKVQGIPRGLVSDAKKLYVGIMSNDKISVIDLKTLTLEKELKIGNTPRHLLLDKNYLYASLSSVETLVKYNLDSLKTEKRRTTRDDPRTISFSADKQLIFVACYGEGKLQIFRTKDLKLLGSWDSKGKPVAVIGHQKGKKLEIWVANHSASTLKVFSFDVEYLVNEKLKMKSSEL